MRNDVVKIKSTVLSADLAESIALVDNQIPHFAANIYKSYLQHEPTEKIVYLPTTQIFAVPI